MSETENQYSLDKVFGIKKRDLKRRLDFSKSLPVINAELTDWLKLCEDLLERQGSYSLEEVETLSELLVSSEDDFILEDESQKDSVKYGRALARQQKLEKLNEQVFEIREQLAAEEEE